MPVPPTTSTTLLRDLGADAQSPRWSELVARYRPALEGFLAARFPSLASESEDLLQETFLTLARRLPGYVHAPDEKGHFRNYLAGILRLHAAGAIRRRLREANALADAAALEPASGDMTEDELREWRHAACEVALSQFLADPATDERTKQVFLRVAIGGEKPAAVAADYGIERNAVDQIRHRVSKRLRALATTLAETADHPARQEPRKP